MEQAYLLPTEYVRQLKAIFLDYCPGLEEPFEQINVGQGLIRFVQSHNESKLEFQLFDASVDARATSSNPQTVLAPDVFSDINRASFSYEMGSFKNSIPLFLENGNAHPSAQRMVTDVLNALGDFYKSYTRKTA